MRKDVYPYTPRFVPHPTREDRHFLRHAIDTQVPFHQDLPALREPAYSHWKQSSSLRRAYQGLLALSAGVILTGCILGSLPDQPVQERPFSAIYETLLTRALHYPITVVPR